MYDNSIRSLPRKDIAIQQAIERDTRGPRLDWMRLLQLKELRLAIAEQNYRLDASLRRQDQFALALARASSRNT